MATEILDAETAQISAEAKNISAHGLQRKELEATARKLNLLMEELATKINESNKQLEATARKLNLMMEELATIPQEMVGKSPKNFSPEEAGRAVVATMQQEEGGSWTGEDLRKQWQLTAATLHKRRKEHRIIYWRDPQNDFHYPKWQFTDSGALMPGIQDVLQIFKSEDEWRVMRYFLGERDQLEGKRPLDLLRDGQIAKVVAHARLHTDENTW